MDIQVSKQPQIVVLSLAGRMDVTGGPEFERMCFSVIAEGQVNLAADLSKVDYISSAGLRSLLVVAKKVKASGGKLVLCGLRGMVKEVFEMSGFDVLLKSYDSLQDLPVD